MRWAGSICRLCGHGEKTASTVSVRRHRPENGPFSRTVHQAAASGCQRPGRGGPSAARQRRDLGTKPLQFVLREETLVGALPVEPTFVSFTPLRHLHSGIACFSAPCRSNTHPRITWRVRVADDSPIFQQIFTRGLCPIRSPACKLLHIGLSGTETRSDEIACRDVHVAGHRSAGNA